MKKLIAILLVVAILFVPTTALATSNYDIPTTVEKDLVHTDLEDIDDIIYVPMVFKYNGHILKIWVMRCPDLRQVSWMLAYDYVIKKANKLKPYGFRINDIDKGEYGCLVINLIR